MENGNLQENQYSILVRKYNEIGFSLDDIAGNGVTDLICLDLLLEDLDLYWGREEPPMQALMKISIMVDEANERAFF